jgi:hypothetical protein
LVKLWGVLSASTGAGETPRDSWLVAGATRDKQRSTANRAFSVYV